MPRRSAPRIPELVAEPGQIILAFTLVQPTAEEPDWCVKAILIANDADSFDTADERDRMVRAAMVCARSTASMIWTRGEGEQMRTNASRMADVMKSPDLMRRAVELLTEAGAFEVPDAAS